MDTHTNDNPQPLNYATPGKKMIFPPPPIPKRIKLVLFILLLLGFLSWMICLTTPLSGFGTLAVGHTFYMLKPGVLSLMMSLGLIATLLFLLTAILQIIYRRWAWAILLFLPAFLSISTYVGNSINYSYFPTRIVDTLSIPNGKTYCSIKSHRSVNQYALGTCNPSGIFTDSYDILAVTPMPNIPSTLSNVQSPIRQDGITLQGNILHVVFNRYCIIQYDLNSRTVTYVLESF